MSRDYWFTSDTHFFHDNMIKYCGRPFSSVEEMNDVMVDNWNSVVKPGDIVYHLGDVFMKASHEDFAKLWAKLNGRKRLIVGNHDDVKYMAKGGFFDKIMLWRAWNEYNLLFSHVPVHPMHFPKRIGQNGGINVHGHTHHNGSPNGPYRSVCVELTNYTPVNLEELV